MGYGKITAKQQEILDYLKAQIIHIDEYGIIQSEMGEKKIDDDQRRYQNDSYSGEHPRSSAPSLEQ